MARQLYPGVFVQLSSGLPGPNMAVSIWNDMTGGTNVTTQIVAADGTSAYSAVTDGNGNLLPFRGPDGYDGSLYVDSSVGIRYLLVSPTLIDKILALVQSITGGGATIQDGSTNTSSVWSSQYTSNQITGLTGTAAFIESVQDIIGSLIAAAGGTYNDAANTITLPSGGSGAGGAAISDNTPSTTTVYSGSKSEALTTGLLSRADFIETVQDLVGALVTAAGGTYNDASGSIAFPAASNGIAVARTAAQGPFATDAAASSGGVPAGGYFSVDAS